MLIGFSVSNYKSFKDTQKFSCMASKVTRHKEHVTVSGNKRILRSGLIFGANAGGKSNFVKAVHFSKEIVVNGLDKVNLSKSHFRIDNAMYREPGVFEYRIMLGQIEYSYGLAVSYSDKIILGEWLVKIGSGGKETALFNRQVDENGISHAESEADYLSLSESSKMDFYLDGFSEDISEAYKRKTILNDIALRGSEKKGIFSEIKNVYEWFTNILIIFPDSKYNAINEVAADSDKKKLFSDFLEFFDTGIEGIEGERQLMDFDKAFPLMSEGDTEKMKTDISNAVEEHRVGFKMGDQFFELHRDEYGNLMYNKLLLNHGNLDDMFEYLDESDGTKRLFDLIPVFYENRKGCLILIDEIDRSLHTNLTRKFFEVFYALGKNRDCQLIATTHDSNLLDLDLLRQDEIWFVERQEDHSSRIFSLNKFKERFDKRIDKEYMLGRYGAIPVFGDQLLLEDNDGE